MKRMIKFPKIGQFRNTIYDVNRTATYVGLDQNNEPIYDPTLSKPKIPFVGTVKLHGTNASVCYNTIDGLWVQSRNNIITPENDNANFAKFVEERRDIFIEMIDWIADTYDISLDVETIVIYGEWAGKGIQKGIAIANLERSFYVFSIKVVSNNNDDTYDWISPCEINTKFNSYGIHNLYDFTKYYMLIDFDRPDLSQNNLIDITNKVEAECPVAKEFGVSGIGEGVVWVGYYNGQLLRFKVKGEEHSSSKVHTLAGVDVERMNSIMEFVDSTVTRNRFDQAITEVFGQEELSRNKIPELLRWIVNDINTEEADTIIRNGFKPKDVNKYIAKRARDMFFAKEKEL